MQKNFLQTLAYSGVIGALLLTVSCKRKDADAKNETAGPMQMYVFAEPALPLRDQPTDAAATLLSLPFGAAVTVDKSSEKPATSSEKTGSWIKATYQGKSGWAFSGFLSPVPLPQANCPGLLDYARSAFTPEGAETRKYDDPAQEKSGSGSYNWQQKFSGGVRADGYVTETLKSMTLFVPVRDEEIGFHICRRCTSHFRSLTYESFKAQNASIKDCGWRTSQGGCLKIWYMEISAADNGLLLKCGADSI